MVELLLVSILRAATASLLKKKGKAYEFLRKEQVKTDQHIIEEEE